MKGKIGEEGEENDSMQGTHGCIHGRTYSKKNKTFPTVQVKDPVHYGLSRAFKEITSFFLKTMFRVQI